MSQILNIQNHRSLGEIGFGPGQCPMVDEATKMCRWHDGGLINCNLIRECDPYTGNVHFEYALPFETGNANIWVVAGPTATWSGPNTAPLVEQLVLPEYVKEAWTFGNPLTSDPTKVHVPIAYQSSPEASTPPPSGSRIQTAPQTTTLAQSQQGSVRNAQEPAPAQPYSPTIYGSWRPAGTTTNAPATQPAAGSGRVRTTEVIHETAGGAALPNAEDVLSKGQQLIEDSGLPWWVWALGVGGVAYLATKEKTTR